MKKGFTIIELAIATALLATILGAVAALFAVGLKNYRVESQRSFLQKELNFVADDIGNQAKQAYAVLENYDIYTRDSDTLILALPAIDVAESFIYSGENFTTDYIIYYLSDGTLYKKTIANENSKRQSRETEVLKNITNFNCLYTPYTATQEIECDIRLNKQISNVTINLQAHKTAKLRNK